MASKANKVFIGGCLAIRQLRSVKFVMNITCYDATFLIYCFSVYPMTWLDTTRILYHGIFRCRSPQCAICCLEHFVVVSNVNNDVMTTSAANNGRGDVTELLVTSQWLGMLWHHKYTLIWCDDTNILWMSNNQHILVFVVWRL